MADVFAIGPNAPWSQIERALDALLGKRFEEIADDSRDFCTSIMRSKSLLGDIIQEDYFRIAKNSREGPDFTAEAIEVKVTPLKLVNGGKEIKQKEALSLSQIDYYEMCREENWQDVTKLTNKLGRTLIIWYLYLDKKEMNNFPDVSTKAELRAKYPVVWWHLWEPLANPPPQLQEDYSLLRDTARDGKHLSRSLTTYLSAIPKHSGSYCKEEPSHSDQQALSEHPYLNYARKLGYYIDDGLIEILAESADIPLLSNQYGEKIPRVWKADLFKAMSAKATGETLDTRNNYRITDFSTSLDNT
ncbi:MutH/Sau3AI family endonuclease [Haloferax sp. DFSO52]|uniref:MutH/Sau3AI family endonuclease n=1 Tax=Haloferax sp. DFSO52 TaxID=3388505 RepID=UPI003A8AE758